MLISPENTVNGIWPNQLQLLLPVSRKPLPLEHTYVWELKVKFWFNLKLIWFRKNIRMGAKPCFSLCAAEFNSQLRNFKFIVFSLIWLFEFYPDRDWDSFSWSKRFPTGFPPADHFTFFWIILNQIVCKKKIISVLWSIRACSKDPDSTSDFEVEI